MPGGSDRVPQFLAAADLFVLPSHLEGMSNAILEAMASGLPVVAHAVGGNPELVEQGVPVCSANVRRHRRPGDAHRAAGERPRAGAMGEAARERAEQIFSLEAMLARYADFCSRGCCCAGSCCTSMGRRSIASSAA
jgi:glycosyltransferase involved in cell wall biosynthesis